MSCIELKSISYSILKTEKLMSIDKYAIKSEFLNESK